ncbi:MAG: hypothetical protein IPJ76_18575 [Flavobacteriales bacterium]|nr:MAG: hypothetical protein IPJ76_18575 [Flavobacteriales bacterium]
MRPTEIIVSLVVGLVGAAIFAAIQSWIIERRHRKKLLHLQSAPGQLDWQHWDIQDGLLAEAPIEAFMSMRYLKNREFEIQWTEKEAPNRVVGTGNIYFENYVVGKLFFIYNERAIYALRDAFYRTVVHNDVEYDSLSSEGSVRLSVSRS